MPRKATPRTEGISRRDAMKAAGAVGVAVTAAKAVKAEAPAFLKSVHAANNQINYGIIGTGGRGQYLLGLLKSVDNGNCVAICDIDDEVLKKGLSPSEARRRPIRTIGSSWPTVLWNLCLLRPRFIFTIRCSKTR